MKKKSGKSQAVEKAASAPTDGVAARLAAIRERPDTRLLCSEDDTFHVLIVYAYASFETCKDLEAVLFKEPHSSNIPSAGLAVFGEAVDELGGGKICLVWMNNESPLMATLTTCVHELVHLSQFILKAAGIDDSSGETQAYTVGREADKVFRELYGIDIPARSMLDRLKGRHDN